MSLWQETQSREAWGDAFRAAALNGGASPLLRFPARAPGSWHAAQSSLPGGGAGVGCWPERPAASARIARARRRDFATLFTSLQTEIGQHLRIFFFHGQDLVAGGAVVVDDPAVRGLVLAVVAAEAAEEIVVADVVGVRAPG